MFVITFFLSGWIVKPISSTMEKQKQFVSDASHELKTPISVRMINILIDNAIKYSGENAKIRVSLFKTGDRPVLEVFNSGSFIDDDEKSKIFDRFYRSDYSRNRQSGGNGLGLSILKTLCTKNLWKPSVTSNKAGVMFSVTL